MTTLDDDPTGALPAPLPDEVKKAAANPLNPAIRATDTLTTATFRLLVLNNFMFSPSNWFGLID
jgi:hypothetical protein